MDLGDSLRRFCSTDHHRPPHSRIEFLNKCLSRKSWSANDKREILDTLSLLLLDVDFTETVASCFSSILKELFLRVTHNNGPDLQLFVALSKLIGYYHDADDFAYELFGDHKFAPFNYVNGRKKRKIVDNQQSGVKKRDILVAAFSYLWYNPSWFRNAWDWSPVLLFLKEDDNHVKWLSMQIVRVILNISDKDLMQWSSQQLAPKTEAELRLEYNCLFKSRQLNIRTEASDASVSTCPSLIMQAEDFSGKIAYVSGIPLRKLDREASNNGKSTFVVVPTFENHLEKMTLAVSFGEPVLIEGPVGSGKTSLIEYLGYLTNRSAPPHLTRIQIGNQIDGKLLIGTYCCTDVPGEFVWKPGPLTSCLVNGHWLVLEDVDYASVDVINIITSVIKSRSLASLPGCPLSSSKINQNFRLFFTQRLTGSRAEACRMNPVQNNIRKLSTVITLDRISEEEVRCVISTLWPALIPIVEKILQIFNVVTTDVSSNEISAYFCTIGSRKTSLRDLFKWCERISHSFCLNSDQYCLDVFLEACDCFLESMPSPIKRLEYAEQIGVKLNITTANSRCTILERKPSIKVEGDHLTIGRVLLQRESDDKGHCGASVQTCIAYTKQFLNLLEKASACVRHNEPVLLVGETGCGKTSSIQYLAQLLGKKLTVVNLNQQSESTDLLGGYKPVELQSVVHPIKKEFDELFMYTYSASSNAKFLSHVANSFRMNRWKELHSMMVHVQKSALTKTSDESLLKKWKQFATKLNRLKMLEENSAALAFAYVEGSLVKAMTTGDWILLDEINLAEAETLQCLSSLLDSHSGSLSLSDRLDNEVVTRHPNFRLFACMNPATDVGKKELPVGIRNRFTEFFVEELTCDHELQILVNAYLKGLISTSQVNSIVQFYKMARCKAETSLNDANGCKPHYSLRSLCRALKVSAKNPCGNIQRSIYEALCMSFLTQLNSSSHEIMEELVKSLVLGTDNAKAVLKNKIARPIPESEYVFCEGYWISKGPLSPQTDETYILTSSVRKNLKNLARVVAVGKAFPVLLQGETSVGKTSMILWLAKASGNICLRVNNHEHTDLQEYIGTYAPDSSGKLVFSEGVLVTAMRKGYWLILDELNLASSEVLEALNRVLDDNRELFIPETGETVKAHPKFILFATQNPPEHYGGRKQLSRAFRNRFIELHYDEIPPAELETILHQKCDLPLSYSKKMVRVLSELRIRRRESGVFCGKHSFITLRDLFRWGERYKAFARTCNERFHDWDLHIANDGYMLLAGRVRKSEEVEVIVEVLQKIFKRKVFGEQLFEEMYKQLLKEEFLPPSFKHIVWTKNLKRNTVLLFSALKNKEPVLLIGETGCGKTTLCQLFASLERLELYTVNCHMHSESADFLGSLRPVREMSANSSLFEWVDGPLVCAMKEGATFLVDEISLADDSVLERLNSVLEPERKLLLAEKNIEIGTADSAYITAADSFRIVGTMNPGGDYGKKELSPALRNRFTEIWCDSDVSYETVMAVVKHNLEAIDSENKFKISIAVAKFLTWLQKVDVANTLALSIRDVLSITQFINATTSTSAVKPIPPIQALYHAVSLVFLDSTGIGKAPCTVQGKSLKGTCEDTLKEVIQEVFTAEFDPPTQVMQLTVTPTNFGLDPFFIGIGCNGLQTNEGFSFSSPTAASNTMKLLRAMQINKSILLEGVPGIGKTTIVSALAKASGHKIIRVNLSEQTDVSDLYGADLPVEGEEGRFVWRDGPLLKALKSKDTWIVLDELNLASQSVLEGLNACLDHRGEIWIAELSKTFHVQKQNTRIFACQNPHSDGGARKGLPKSFLNRFTTMFFEPLTDADLNFILIQNFPRLNCDVIARMVQFNNEMVNQFGNTCGEFNLRDLYRWAKITSGNLDQGADPGHFVRLIYSDRFRSVAEKKLVMSLYEKIFGSPVVALEPDYSLSLHSFQISNVTLKRQSSYVDGRVPQITPRQLPHIHSMMNCVNMNWMVILTGPTEVGKTTLVNLLALTVGQPLNVLSVNSEMDTIDLLGGFDQKRSDRHFALIHDNIWTKIKSQLTSLALKTENCEKSATLLRLWHLYLNEFEKCARDTTVDSTTKQLRGFENFVNSLEKVCPVIHNDAKVTLDGLKSHFNNGNFGRGGAFEWTDSVLVESLIKGDWLLIDDVNLCPASVLDRLNSLLEPDGVLAINEQGAVDDALRVISPHPNFRLFLTMDPKNGELSRAMRNRGIEIYVEPSNCSLDVLYQLRHLGLHDNQLLRFCVGACNQLTKENCSATKSQGELLKLCTFITHKLQLCAKSPLAFKEEMLHHLNIEEVPPLASEEELMIASRCPATDLKLWLGDAEAGNVLRDACLLQLDQGRLQLAVDTFDNSLTVDTITAKFLTPILFLERASMRDYQMRVKILTEHKSCERLCVTALDRIRSTAKQLLMFGSEVNCVPMDVRNDVVLWNKIRLKLNDYEVLQLEHLLDYWKLVLFHSFLKDLESCADADSALNLKHMPSHCFQLAAELASMLCETTEECFHRSCENNDSMVTWGDLYWVHEFSLLVRGNKRIASVDQFRAWWALICDKLSRSKLASIHLEKFVQISKGLDLLSVEQHRYLYKCAYNNNESPSYFNSENTAALFVKILETSRSVYSCVDFSELVFVHDWQKMLACLLRKLRNGQDLEEIEEQLNSLKLKIQTQARTYRGGEGDLHDLDECEDSDLLKIVNKRYHFCKRPLVLLWQMCFSVSEISEILTNSSNLAQFLRHHNVLCNPLHAELIGNIENKFSPDIVLHHFSDFHEFLNSQKFSYWLQRRHADSSSEVKVKYRFSPECSAALSAICTRLLSEELLNLASLDEKATHIETLRKFMCVNYTAIVRQKNFNILQNQVQLLLSWSAVLEQTMKSLKIEDLFHLNHSVGELVNCDISSENLRKVGTLFCAIGMATCYVFAPLASVDPILRNSAKLERYERELYYCKVQLVLRNAGRLIHTGVSYRANTDHHDVKVLFQRVALLENKIAKLRKRNRFRPETSLYHSLRNTTRHFLRTVLAIDNFTSLIHEVNHCKEDAVCRTLERRCSQIQTSIENFLAQLQSSFALYSDLINNFSVGVCIVLSGMKMLVHYLSLQNMLNDLKMPVDKFRMYIESLVTPFCIDPFKKAKSILAVANSFVREKSDIIVKRDAVLLLKSILVDVENILALSGPKKPTLKIFSKVVAAFLKTWQVEEEERQAKLEEEAALYRYKSESIEGELPEEEQEKLDLVANFPTFDNVFEDAIDEQSSVDFHNVQAQDKMEIFDIHSDILRTLSASDNCHKLTLTKSLGLQYRVFSDLLTNLGNVPFFEIDSVSSDAHVIVSSMLLKSATSELDQLINVYKENSPKEVKLCNLAVRKLENRVTQLLREFPGHPSLREILKIINRMMDFSVGSPVAKFLTGLELLLQVAQEWESKAHRGISLREQLDGIADLVVRWRKMELNNWAMCLDNVNLKIKQDQLLKWWFHFYWSITALLEEGEKDEENLLKLLNSLKTFLESSNLGQYEVRLAMLRDFWLHVKVFGKDENYSRLCNLFQNVLYFYSLFEEKIKEKVVSERSPIEKEVKQFVKIMRWNDKNFESLRAAIDKAHRTLNRHMKNYEKSLQQPSQPHFSLTRAQYKPSWTLNIALNMSETRKHQFLETNFHTLENMKRYYAKSFDVIEAIPSQVEAFKEQILYVNDLSTAIIEGLEEFENYDFPDQLQDKEKFRKSIRRLHNRKQQSLSELWRELSRGGLSYKAGLIFYSTFNLDTVFLTYSSIPEMSLCSSWAEDLTSMNRYFYSSLVRFAALQSALCNPSKDLTPNTFERIRGFTGAMFSALSMHREKFFQQIRDFTQLQLISKEFVNTNQPVTLCKQNQTSHWLTKLQDLIFLCSSSFAHLKLLVSSFVQDAAEDVHVVEQRCPLSNHHQLSAFHELLEDVNTTMDELRTQMESFRRGEIVLFLDVHLSKLSEMFKNLVGACTKILSLIEGLDHNAICGSIRHVFELCQEVRRASKSFHVNFDNFLTTPVDDTVSGVVSEKCALLLESMLKGIQSVAKFAKGDAKNSPTQSAEDEDGKFKNAIVNSVQLAAVCDKLNTWKVLQGFNDLYATLGEMYKEKASRKVAQLLGDLVIFLDHYLTVCEYLHSLLMASYRSLCKLMYLLMGLFTSLASKGFCLPAEMEDKPENTKGMQFRDIDDGGLGEGEGVKDVSKNIESEDQLDDTFQAGQQSAEKDTSEKDIDAEDDAVEMSEDFEGKAYSPETEENKEDGEESEEETSDTEIDKKMGDVEDEDDVLDKEIWGTGSDAEEDRGDESNEGGESKDESKMVAKGDNLDDGANKEKDDEQKAEDEQEDGMDRINEQVQNDEYEGEHEDQYKSQERETTSKEEENLPDDMELDKNEMEEDGERNEVSGDELEGDQEDKTDGGDEELEDRLEEDDPTDTQPFEADENMDGEGQNPEVDREEGEEETDEPREGNELAKNISITPQENVPSVPHSDNSGGTNITETNAANGENQHEDLPNVEDAPADNTQKMDTSVDHSDAANGKQTTASSDGTVSKGVSSDEKTRNRKREKNETNKKSVEISKEESVERKTVLDAAEEKDSQRHEVNEEHAEESSVFQHLNENEVGSKEVVDLAQEEEQNKYRSNNENESCEDPNAQDEGKFSMETCDDAMEVDEEENPKQEGRVTEGQKGKGENQPKGMSDDPRDANKMETDIVSTELVSRGVSTIHTTLNLEEVTSDEKFSLLEHAIEKAKQEDHQMDSSLKDWLEVEKKVTPLVHELCQQLQLVLEPSKTSKLKGDYKTGKRLNMRKVIAYIASQFRRDKIWLRRTKPNARQYQIVLAVDDSSSMADSRSKELAFESLALLGRALSLVEAGDLAVMSFGEDTRLLHTFEEPFTATSGARLLSEFQFNQNHTRIAELLNKTLYLVMTNRKSSHRELSQLLIIMSDGRGLFNEGKDHVQQSIRRLKEFGVFVVFIVLDNPANADSILDIRVPIFDNSGKVRIETYMEKFPFPFYLILRNIESLPQVLGEALRQWFELVTAYDK